MDVIETTKESTTNTLGAEQSPDFKGTEGVREEKGAGDGRDEQGRWVKGVSGNPEGAKPWTEEEKKIKRVEKEALEEIKQRIIRNADTLIDAQLSLAKGTSYLYCIEKDKDGKKQKPRLVTDPDIIAEYIDGEYGEGESINDEKEYYYISTEKPSGFNINSLLDRTFGKPTQTTELTGKDGRDLIPSPLLGGKSNVQTDESDN